jgi:serine/threonine protein phosphatase PrpC
MRLSDATHVDAYGTSDVGLMRANNQDQFLVAELHKVIEIAHTSLPEKQRQTLDSGTRALMLLVADGVGGGPGGQEASSVTLDTVLQYVTNSMRCFYKLDHEVQAELMSELARIVSETDATVRSEGNRIHKPNMATTLTMAHVLWPRAYVVQIGDSRCYHVRGSSMAQITKDQTIAEGLIERGLLDREHAEKSPFKDVLSQAIGAGDAELEAEISTVDLEPGDHLLLCTDGLTKHVPDEQILSHFQDAPDARSLADGLVKAAIDGGGSDNITIVVAKFSS